MKQLEELAEFASKLDLENVPDAVRVSAKSCIIDSLSAAIGGTANPMFQTIRETYLAADQKGEGGAPLLADERTASLHTAVFLNAMCGHALELDDVHIKSKTHIGTVVVPAAWTLAQYLGRSGKDLMEAVICGYEVTARIGMGFGVSSHRNLGWHVTGTAGPFGAAAACGHLMGFTPDQMLAAFGLAGTLSCNTWAFLSDGASNKILHPGHAAASGLDACLLVQGGMRGSAHILDAADGGIYPMMSQEYNYDLVNKDLGSVYEIIRVDKKPYSCCRSIHCAVEAALKLREDHSIVPEEVEAVTVNTYLVGLKQCGLSASSRQPHVGTEAKFSTPYATACAFLTGRVALQDFEPEAIDRPERQAFLRKVTVREDPKFTARYPAHWGCRMEVELKDGTVYSQEIMDASGSVDSPLTDRQLMDKAALCCEGFDPAGLKRLIDGILRLEDCGNVFALSVPMPVSS